MKKSCISILYLPLFLFMFITAVQAADINVPGDYGTIQAALDAASDGDTIIVADGTYNVTLLWPDEIRDPDFPSLDAKVEVRAPELKMAGQVVESMAADFHPEEFTDTYQEQLRELVEAKLAGGEAFTTEEKPTKLDETEDVSDLLAKLEASVRRRREESAAKEPAGEPAKAAAKKAPAKKAAAKKAAAKKAPAKKVSR